MEAMMAKEKNEVKIGKDSFLQSERFAEERALLSVLLKDGESYTSAEVEQILKQEKERVI
jgi:glutamyl/glutaminyl-tRNA synthetase